MNKEENDPSLFIHLFKQIRNPRDCEYNFTNVHGFIVFNQIIILVVCLCIVIIINIYV